VAITDDSAKRDRTLDQRGLDLAAAEQVVARPRATFWDVRRGYGEDRRVTVGFLTGRRAVDCGTPRGDDRHVF
jgi:uncharacterized DUF497 family protein